MTTADHVASYACYKRGCKQPACITAGRRYAKGLSVDLARGIRRVCDATQARIHIDRLKANNWKHRQIAAASGVPQSTVTALAGGQKTTGKRIALSILSVPIGPPPAEPAKAVDATGSIRRVRALAWMGHSLVSLSRRLDISEDRLSTIARAVVAVVRPDEARRITALYRQLVKVQGPNERVRQDARKKGWHGPLAWDDIDDPNCQPETDGAKFVARRHKAVVDPQKVAHLTAIGRTAEQIANELGCHKRSVVRARRRAEQQLAA